MVPKIHDDPEGAKRRLRELGLDESVLLEAAQRGQAVRAGYTDFYPTSFPGLAAWAETVAALREALCLQGWHSLSESNFCLVASPDYSMAIAVATGDEATGDPEREPQTKSAKGKKTVQAVSSNIRQLSLFDALGIRELTPSCDTSSVSTRTTWLLLIHRDSENKELRCELSLPTGMDEDQRVDGWAERILLSPTSLDGDDGAIDDLEPQGPEIDFDIPRRA
jgi:hypothetical protein